MIIIAKKVFMPYLLLVSVAHLSEWVHLQAHQTICYSLRTQHHDGISLGDLRPFADHSCMQLQKRWL